MYPHRIRLRGPWDCEPVAPGNPGRRVTLPARLSEIGLASFHGRVRFRRRFGYPGQIDPYERVWLTFAGVGGIATVSLNDSCLGKLTGPGEFDATALLRPRNELVVELEGDADGGLWGEVALEVRCSAYLRHVAVEAVPASQLIDLHVRGEVAGVADEGLELYVVLDRSTVAYAAAAAGPFHLVAPGLSPAPWHERPADMGPRPVARVDLVRGASVWFRTEQEVPLDAAAEGTTE